MSDKALKKFSQEMHKKYVKQAWLEGVVALLPLVAIGVGFVGIATRPNAQELFSPAKMGVGKPVIIILLVAYVVFLFFMMRDIKRRVSQK